MSAQQLRGPVFMLALVLLAPSGPLEAQVSRGEPSTRHTREFLPNYVSILTGATTQSGRDRSSSFTLGLSYARRIGTVYGLGAVGEWVSSGDQREVMLGALFHMWLSGGLVLSIGPGVELADLSDDDDSDAEDPEMEDLDSSAHGVARVGLAYYVKVGERYNVTPMASVDLVSSREPVWVWGVSFGVGF